MNNYTLNSCLLSFFDNIIKDAVTDFPILKGEHQISPEKALCFSDFLHCKVIIETNNIADHLKNLALSMPNESELIFNIKKIQTHLKEQIFKLKRLSFEGVVKIIEALEFLQFRIAQLLSSFKQIHDNSPSFLLPEIEAAHRLLQPNVIKTTLFDELITVVCSLGTVENITSTFLPNFRERYAKLSLEKQRIVEDRIHENYQTKKAEQFQLFLESNYQMLISLNHPEIRGNLANCDKSNNFHYTELFVRSEIQVHFVEPLLQFIQENFPPEINSYPPDNEGRDLRLEFDTSRINVTLLFLALQHIKFLKGTSNDYQLAKCIEEKCLYKEDKPMRKITTLISQIRSQEVNYLPALQEIYLGFQDFFKKMTL